MKVLDISLTNSEKEKDSNMTKTRDELKSDFEHYYGKLLVACETSEERNVLRDTRALLWLQYLLKVEYNNLD
jgi:hypothetical protein